VIGKIIVPAQVYFDNLVSYVFHVDPGSAFPEVAQNCWKFMLFVNDLPAGKSVQSLWIFAESFHCQCLNTIVKIHGCVSAFQPLCPEKSIGHGVSITGPHEYLAGTSGHHTYIGYGSHTIHTIHWHWYASWTGQQILLASYYELVIDP
jgi:hypothetical protein